MVTVKLFGTFRLDSRVKCLYLDVKNVREIYPLIIDEVKRLNSSASLTEKDLKGCIVSVNGKQVRPSAKLKDGDEVCLMPAVAGG